MSETKEKTAVKEIKPQAVFFVNKTHSALTVVKADGTRVTFKPFYETFRGERVRVGYLKVDAKDKDLLDRVSNDTTCQEITEKEYNEGMSGTPAFMTKVV